MKATNHPICKFEDMSKEWGRACAGRGTHQGEDGREEEEVGGEDWREVVAFAAAWGHFASGLDAEGREGETMSVRGGRPEELDGGEGQVRSGERFNDVRPTCQMTIVTPPPMPAFSRVSASPCLGLSSVPGLSTSTVYCHPCPLPLSATLSYPAPSSVSSPSRPRPPRRPGSIPAVRALSLLV